MISDRLSQLSCSEEVFKSQQKVYDEALKNAGYTEKLVYTEAKNKKKYPARSRKVIWFNPPFCQDLE